jgi:hypothetical protein
MTTKAEQLEHEARMIAINEGVDLERRKVAALETIAEKLSAIAWTYDNGVRVLTFKG